MMVLDILLVVLIIAATVLCVYLIISLSNLNRSVDSLQKDIHLLIEKTIPVLENMNDTVNKVNKVVTEAEGYWEDLNAAIESAKEKLSKLSLRSRFDKSENPIQHLIKNLSAIVKGISAFWSELTS